MTGKGKSDAWIGDYRYREVESGWMTRRLELSLMTSHPGVVTLGSSNAVSFVCSLRRTKELEWKKWVDPAE